ncbi:nitrilase-related carbon-nitrogen hydrolase [Fodinicurvata halophila]|uniref:Nitrilase-related carbon-nitrogen hydrolase n=1 Tax=Fodinicurvata halophila TaxID=1419723 RepID=A0ABV8UNY3_9PROT
MKAGLIQMSLKGETDLSPDVLREHMLDAHEKLIDQAGAQGVQVLCMQEIFNQPYFCAVTDDKWFNAAEEVPDGPTVQRISSLARKHEMVIVAPIYEIDDGKYYNTAAVIDADGRYLGKYRKNHIPNLPQGKETYYFEPSNMGYPVFDTRYCKLGVYICYDRHFPEGWRALALNGAEYVVNPSATPADLSRYLWQIEQPAAAVANGFFIGAINRVGREAPWNIGDFYGSSYFVSPKGQIIAQASDDQDELVVADLNLEEVKEVRSKWKFFEARQPGTYAELTK